MNIKPQVLVIDDDEVVGRSFDRVLADKGYEVSTALSGEDALSKLDDTEYDVVFTDIKMPGMDGLEVAERIMARCPWTPVVVITGYGTEENEARARVLGTQGFVRKPLTPEIIESVTLKAVQTERRPRPAEPAQTAGEETAPEVKRHWLKNVGLFFAAPFIGLAYVIALPFVFFGMLGKTAFQAMTKKKASG